MVLESAVRTNKGNIRDNNEDNFYIYDTYAQIEEANSGCAYRKFSNDKFQVYAVCDGMGGCDLGEIAAYTVVSNLKNLKITSQKDAVKKIQYFLDEMNTKCREISDKNRLNSVCAGCTIAMIFIVKKDAYIVNAGDSRIYLWRENKLIQLTYDHTYAQLLYSKGEINIDDIATHPQNNVLVQYIGMPEDNKLEPYISKPFKIKKGDIFILCSDGLTDMLGDSNIAKTFAKSNETADICKTLISDALSNGGDDNVTVMTVKCVK